MKMKKRATKKGFTLIELLAVIVILAIVALIAVPVILNIIDKANKSAFKDSAYGIIQAAEYYFAASQLELNGLEDDKVFDLSEVNELKLKGDIPKGTVVVTKSGDIAIAVRNDRYCVMKWYSDEDVTITESIENCNLYKNGIMLSDNSCITNNNNCSNGTKINVQVNDNQSHNFYVVSEENNKVTLIMDRNLGTTKAWVSGSDYTANASCTNTSCNDQGPITILNYLTSQIETENWENIPAIESYEYKNNPDETGTTKTYGYQKLNITNGAGVLTSKDGSTTTLSGTMRARLLTYEEANRLKTNNGGTTPKWLYDYLSSSNTLEKPYGYWLLTASPSSSNIGRYVNYSGSITYGHNVYSVTHRGARPVIELSKSL